MFSSTKFSFFSFFRFENMTAVFGVHHYIHYYDWKLNLRNRPKGMEDTEVLINTTAVVLETLSFFNELKSFHS